MDAAESKVKPSGGPIHREQPSKIGPEKLYHGPPFIEARLRKRNDLFGREGGS